MYGSGARLDFSHFLTGPTTVSVDSVEAIQDWLLGCQYESDEVLFGEADFWQHPATFERLRAGDCEDFSLWAWRKLLELKIDADIVVGYWVKGGSALDTRHAWIVFRRDNVEYLFETVCRNRTEMIRPLAEARDDYLPQFGVDKSGRRFAFYGYTISQKRLLQRKSSRRTA